MNNVLPALPALIHCPNCRNRKDYVTLGSVTTQGYVIINRKFGRQTLIMAETYSLICDCGYFIRIENGKIIAEALSGTMLNANN